MYTLRQKHNYHIVKNVRIRILSVTFFFFFFFRLSRKVTAERPLETNPIKTSGLQSQGKRFAYVQCCTL